MKKKKYFVRKYFLSRKAGAPDGVEAPVGEVVHEVDVKADEGEDEVDVDVVVVDPDVHVGCDMPMSIYSQHFFITFCK